MGRVLPRETGHTAPRHGCSTACWEGREKEGAFIAEERTVCSGVMVLHPPHGMKVGTMTAQWSHRLMQENDGNNNSNDLIDKPDMTNRFW